MELKLEAASSRNRAAPSDDSPKAALGCGDLDGTSSAADWCSKAGELLESDWLTSSPSPRNMTTR
ncbi:hypothetical protein E2562_019973 [Oryza meyeriana var. granulata]|uniref:Uncharacterized protein n=1 Tax=Oryza meyeriana var. granulata TaxID=110450 RepID=A0A6G1CIP0_9ORYZ|nr:hypothetical protein E2562_019973 [Oryza meyeriana var. granulata]